ncbi:FAD-dependent oxidoreductase [Simiduia curdlanivorans]|uniref:FAD-dependent oxidoreductase n=1 Tax=Simiduia curdlanivorans TaxID=1492769 RepID=A0ABV8V5W1_9GAMM|nr:FAD-dependent oxidoreductase [Simiduia curdlanivorans]MDN3638420.1 FAD-dependent oxidoreductase [Simiduia curdlanivorans]
MTDKPASASGAKAVNGASTLGPEVTRRDFCQGALMGAAAWSVGAPSFAAEAADYPPLKTGMRGAHIGSFEVAHGLAREGKVWLSPNNYVDPEYDVVIVGAGISGLATAYFYQQAMGPAAKILLLDNHDDFGGHAKRNEFTVEGKTLIGYGGSQSIDSPGSYSKSAKQLLLDLGVETERFYTLFDRDYFRQRKLTKGLFLTENFFGKRCFLAQDFVYNWEADQAKATEAAIDELPFSDQERASLSQLLFSSADFLAPMTVDEKLSYLLKNSYSTYLTDKLHIPAKVLALVEERLDGWWGLGTDALSAMEAYRNDLPGFSGLGLPAPELEHGDEPYIFHFPDGNASLARLLVRKLIPSVAAGDSMDDIVKAAFDYAQLDVKSHAVKLRLNSTVVRAENNQSGVDVTYVQAGAAYKVKAKAAVMACYNAMIPHLCPQLPPVQKQALAEQVKVPMAYVNVALKNWRALAKAGVREVNCPRSFFTWVTMDFPVSMGGYAYAQSEHEPVLLHMPFYPKSLGQGLAAKQQYRLGRYRLLALSFADFEREVVAQLTAMFAPFGFDAKRDISAITVNRWPHGYAYEYVDLFDPAYGPGEAPHERARRPFGRIHIGNSDSQAFAYVDGAIDAARRVVDEILA